MKKIRVLVVDDSAFMRKVISDLLMDDQLIEVIATARNGEDALKKLKTLKPDVMTLDVEMPVMDGIATLKRVMKEHPLPVVMISSVTKEGTANTLAAMELGAVDFITKTSGPISLDLHKVKAELIEKVKLASQVNVVSSKIKKKPVKLEKPIQKEIEKTGKKLIAIGTSTGGPKALQKVLTQLPKGIEAPILIVQHMPSGFTKSLGERLNRLCKISVKEAEDGEVLRNGVAYIAPGGLHMKVEKKGNYLSIKCDETALRRGHRPSVDVLFESIAQMREYEVIAVIMTGMGTDGADGVKALKRNVNCFVIAESEESSVVFGMPKAAIKTNFVDEVAHLEDISDSIIRVCQS